MANAVATQKTGEAKGLRISTASPDQLQFHACGPHNLPPTNWKDPNYRRIAMACFVQAAYLQELDRQENRDERTGLALAPQWWRPFNYRRAQVLGDDRDGSFYGVVLEWDGHVPSRPDGAPAAVVALRGTLLKKPTATRDVVDDLRLLAWDSLKGSVRFAGALAALRDAARRHGAGGVCVAGHSLGAGFALQVGKALAKEGVFVECHVFNPPSVSLPMSLRRFAETAGEMWGRVRSRLPHLRSAQLAAAAAAGDARSREVKAPSLESATTGKWLPHLYINTNDYVCCRYDDAAGGTATATAGRTATAAAGGGDGKQARASVATIVRVSKGPTKFLDAHQLHQWWADDVELQVSLDNSKLIARQLRSLYAAAHSAGPQLKLH
ncbi:hypothetical protein ACP70R_037048 [Stipagrostis hirtigluma subsp. patula]